jgi:hypothetical protein
MYSKLSETITGVAVYRVAFSGREGRRGEGEKVLSPQRLYTKYTVIDVIFGNTVFLMCVVATVNCHDRKIGGQRNDV